MTQWPLYLVTNDSLEDKISSLNLNLDSDFLREYVADIALECLNEEWMNETYERWKILDGIDEGERSLILDALDRHKHGDYIGCVAILMCMYEGFAEGFFNSSAELSYVDVELYDWEASKHNMNGKIGRKLGTKDFILHLFFHTENGWLIWQRAISYAIDIVLTNKYTEDIAAHNPLRNKICHGIQTNYNTWEHSVKAILATDILLQLGATALTALNN